MNGVLNQRIDRGNFKYPVYKQTIEDWHKDQNYDIWRIAAAVQFSCIRYNIALRKKI